MKKNKVVIKKIKLVRLRVLLLILAVLCIPIPFHLKDGGTVEYKAILYKISKVHRLNTADSSSPYIDGTIVKILGFEVYNNVKDSGFDLNAEREKNFAENSGNTEVKEYIKDCLKRLNSLGIDSLDQEKQVIENVLEMPKDMLDEINHEQILGLVFDYVGNYDYDLGKNEYNLNNKNIYSFDEEVFEEDKMYTIFLNNINILTNNEFNISNINEDLSNVDLINWTGTQVINFDINGKSYIYETEVDGDWFNLEIIKFINEILENEKSDKFLYTTTDGWQNCVVFYNNQEWADKFNQTFNEVKVEKM